MEHQRAGRLSRLWEAGLDRKRLIQRARALARVRLGVALVVVVVSTAGARAQSNSSEEVPVTLLSDHIVREGEFIFMSTGYPIHVAADQGKAMIAAAGSYLRCKAGASAKNKNSLPLSDCQMLFQSMNGAENHTYTGNLTGSGLSIRWRHRLFWDQAVNAGETWQGAVGSFAIGSTTALFTGSHTIIAVGTAIGFVLTGVGPLAKHHPHWFLPSERSAIPDNRTLLFNSGQTPLIIGSLTCVGEDCPQPPSRASTDPLPQSPKATPTAGPQ